MAILNILKIFLIRENVIKKLSIDKSFIHKMHIQIIFLFIGISFLGYKAEDNISIQIFSKLSEIYQI